MAARRKSIRGRKPQDRFGLPHLKDSARSVLAWMGLDRSYRKIFAIGFNKTATTSIDRVFADAGLHANHSTRWRSSSAWRDHLGYQAFSDGPPDDFRMLDRRFPRALFILNTRDLDAWMDSRIEHIRHLTTRGTHVDQPGWSLAPASLDSWVRNRNAHHLAVLDHFRDRPQDLLVINFIRDADAAARLSAFIGGPPVTEKPHAHPISARRDQSRIRNAAMLAECFDRLGLPEDERQTDLWCPSLTPRRRGDWPADTSTLSWPPPDQPSQEGRDDTAIARPESA
jgi:hypothetical protein